MTYWKRAVLVIEYDDGAQSAFEFTQLSNAVLNHGGLPGPAEFRIVGRCQAWRMPAPVEQAFTTAIDSLAPTGDTDGNVQ